MSVLERLSSARGETTEASNKAVAAEALAQPEILDEVAAGLALDDRKLLGDCVEVFTEVAKVQPALVAPYAQRLMPLLPDLEAKIERDRSVIVRDCAVIALGEYGRSGPEAARQVFPLLRDALGAWEGKHAKWVLEGMAKLLAVEPALGPEVQAAARTHLDHKRANVRRLAQRMVQV
jgi:hypothetical protein